MIEHTYEKEYLEISYHVLQVFLISLPPPPKYDLTLCTDMTFK